MPRGDVDAIVLCRHGSQQRALTSLCRLQVALEPRFFFRKLFVQPRVLQRNGEIRRKDRKSLDVILGEIIRRWALEIQNANDLALVHHGNRQF